MAIDRSPIWQATTEIHTEHGAKPKESVHTLDGISVPPSNDATTERPSTAWKPNDAARHCVCIGEPICPELCPCPTTLSHRQNPDAPARYEKSGLTFTLKSVRPAGEGKGPCGRWHDDSDEAHGAARPRPVRGRSGRVSFRYYIPGLNSADLRDHGKFVSIGHTGTQVGLTIQNRYCPFLTLSRQRKVFKRRPGFRLREESLYRKGSRSRPGRRERLVGAGF